MTISRTARVWVNEIRTKKSVTETQNYFKEIFTEEEYGEFYSELMGQTKECVMLNFKTLNIVPREKNTMNEIFGWMDVHINYFEFVDYITNSIYTEIFQTVTGFFGKGCDDSQFEDVRDAMGDFSWGELMDVYEYILAEEKPTINEWGLYVRRIEEIIHYSLPAVKLEQTKNETNKLTHMKEKIASTELVSATIKRTGINLIYAIMNTSEYDGGMGVVIVEGMSPRILIDYGFEEGEIIKIARLEVGESWADSPYGKGVVVVRMA
jgi:hypothetical protein